MIHIYDGNWVVRKAYECDSSGLAMRNLFNDAFHQPDPQIWVFDGKNAKAERKAIFPGYKAKRLPGSDEFYKTMDLYRELLTHSNKLQIRIAGYEGDDVIAALVRSTPNVEILLHANDGDFHVLCNDFVKMTNPALPKVPNSEVRLYKTLVGDSSDEIPGLKRFGAKSYEGLQDSMKAKWLQWFDLNPYAADQKYPIYLPSKISLGLTDGLYDTFQRDWKDLTAFWHIVGFMPIPKEVLVSHTICGTANYQKANEMLKGVMQ